MNHYFTNTDLEHNKKEINVIFKETKFTFFTDNGVFSKSGLDFGTRTLLENINFEELKGDILDFGCGYGPIGIITSKLTNLEIDMLDINERSLDLAKQNSKLNNTKTNIFKSDIYENVTKKYDTNPPIRVGNEILHKILFEAKNHLKEKGKMYLVVNKDQGAKSLAKKLENYYNVQIIGKNKGFFVILCSK